MQTEESYDLEFLSFLYTPRNVPNSVNRVDPVLVRWQILCSPYNRPIPSVPGTSFRADPFGFHVSHVHTDRA